MGCPAFPFLHLLIISFSFLLASSENDSELKALMDLKESLDPKNRYLGSWTSWEDPCGGTFEGIVCNEKGQVANISLQGKGLSGKLSPGIGELKHLTGLFLHYNSLYGEIPKEISSLTELTDLYLNVNNLSGEIPQEIGHIRSLQVVQLCYNKISGSIPTVFGDLKKLTVLALQSNQLTGAIPASLGDLGSLRRLDLSFNRLFGSIPSKLAEAPSLEVLNVRNNMLSGNVPLALKKMMGGFHYDNNLGLCGVGFTSLRVCSDFDHPYLNRPEPYGEAAAGFSTKNIPETANLRLNCSGTHCSHPSKASQASVFVGVVIISVIVSAIGFLTFSHYRRVRQKIDSKIESTDHRPSLDQTNDVCKENGSPLISLEYSTGWDPSAEGRRFTGVCQEVLQTFRFNLEEIESATQSFTEKNLLGRSNFSATYKGILRDGSYVSYLDVGECSTRVLEWSTRIKIINGIAKGIKYLHESKVNKPALIHQNLSAKNVLFDQWYKPLLSDSGLHKLLTNDTVFSTLKTTAAKGYLAPEYTTTGRFTDKSDIYAFGVLVFQIISGKATFSSSVRVSTESCKIHDLFDSKLRGKFSESEFEKVAKIALNCTHHSPDERPSMETVVEELHNP
ncbi:hypothetical protein Leryth_025634 [Lithospermum erythrorhizon]|nr:hypothetical protein Leryth_025634 [Lithospermum erythrorhizon]